MGTLLDCPASRLTDAQGTEVYASVFFAEFDAGGTRGLAGFGPDDELELVGTFGRYGASILDGCHRLYPSGVLPAELPDALPIAPSLRLSFVLVSAGGGPQALRVSTPANAQLDRVPLLAEEPDSYRIIKHAQASDGFASAPAGARRLWDGPFVRQYGINPDRDLNGVGLLYFANYVAFLDTAERDALSEYADVSPRRLDSRTTLRRRIAYYANALPTDRLEISVTASMFDGDRLYVQHRVQRVSDGRLVALAEAERQLRRQGSPEAIE